MDQQRAHRAAYHSVRHRVGNGDVFGLVDAISLLLWQFAEGDDPPCMDAADVNDDGEVTALTDALALVSWAFVGGEIPPDPGPDECGLDPEEDEVDCLTVADECA